MRLILRAFTFVLVLVLSLSAQADVKLAAIFGSNMVLQRDQALPIWGWAEPGEEVSVALGDNKASAKAGADGKWAVKLAPMKAAEKSPHPAHTLVVKGKNEIKLTGILIGEVWLCSGQSNMEWTVNGSLNPAEEAKNANYPEIRHYLVPKRPAGEPEADVAYVGVPNKPGQTMPPPWQICSPQTVGGFTGVGFFFARALQKEIDLPIGIVHSSWGGTRIEPWTPINGFEGVPATKDMLDHIARNNDIYREFVKKNLDRGKAWTVEADKAIAEKRPVPQLPGGVPKHPLDSSGQPTGLYNGMIHPLVPFAIRGAIWYQGESNRGQGMRYTELKKALIEGWRKTWNQETNRDFPFIFVQLAPYNYGNQPTALPEIWEAQTATLSAVPNTGMAVTTDIGDPKDIHPRNKQEVGRRLALWALANTYGKKDTVYSGPMFKSAKFDGGNAVISFDHAAGLKTRDGKELSHFQIAGEDRKFVPAKAVIEGDNVVVTGDGVSKAAAVRFGWDHTAEPNLANGAGLPASPFRTDKWEEQKK